MVAIQLPPTRRATLATRTARIYEPPVIVAAPAAAAAPPLARRVQGTLQPRPPGHPVASFVSSLGAHLLLLGVIIVATQASVGPALITAPDTTLVFLPRLRPIPARQAMPAPPPAAPAAVPAAGALLVANPPPKGFQTVVAPVAIPAEIPPVDPAERPYDPRDFTGVGVEGGVSYGVVGGTGPVDQAMTAGLAGSLFTETSTAARFVPAKVLFQPPPVYPRALLRAGITGSVRVRFIIDTLGRVEERSIEVLESSSAGFDPAVRATINGSRFEPAHLGPVPVRQLTEQRVRFVLASGPGGSQ